MSTVDFIVPIVLAIGGTFLAAIFSGSEMGVYSVNRVRLSLREQAAATPSNTRARWVAGLLSKELASSSRLLGTILIGYNMASYLAAIGTTNLLIGLGYSELGIVVLNTLLIGPVLFVLADAMPKEIFRAEADRLMYALAPLLRLCRVLCQISGVLLVIRGATNLVERFLPVEESGDASDPRQRISELIKEGASNGLISDTQLSMLDRAFALREVRVADEMVPWAKVKTLSTNWARSKLLDTLGDKPASRYPLLDASGKLIGIVKTTDVLSNPDSTLESLAEEPTYIEPGHSVRAALLTLKAEGIRLAIVRDRGRPVGLVTAKDLVEPLTGELTAW